MQTRDWIDPERIALFGSSFGGNAAILHAAGNPALRALGLKSPITNYPQVRERQLGKNKIEEWRQKGIIQLNDGTWSNYGFFDDALHIDTYDALRHVKAPIWVVQGDHDEDVTMDHVRVLQQTLDKDKDELVMIEGANHPYTHNPITLIK